MVHALGERPLTLPVLADLPAAPSASDARQALVFQSQRIRGACVLAVILIHVTSSPDGTPLNWSTAIALFLNGLARFAVPCFMVLSAFHLSLNSRNEKPLPFYRRTLMHLVVSYVAYSTGYVVLTHRQFSGFLEVWLPAILTGTAYVHLWFIPVILLFYLLHPFLRRWYRRTERAGGWVVVALIFQLGWAVATSDLNAALSTDSWLAPAKVLRAFFCYVGYFLAGYFLYDHAGEVVALARRRAFVILMGLAWLVVSVVMFTIRGASLQFSTVPGAGKALEPLLCLAAFVMLATWRSRGVPSGPIERLLEASGLYAFGVYYLHMLVLAIFSWGWRHYVELPMDHGLFYLLAFPSVSVLSLLAVKLVARLPFGRYLA